MIFETLTNLFHPGWRMWQDVYIYAGWRVQHHALHDIYRVVDPAGRKTIRPTQDACLALITAEKARGLKPVSDHLVLLVPGLNNLDMHFLPLEREIRKAGYDCLQWRYASNRATAAEHAARLGAALQRLEGTQTISFVTHSLGGLILRVLLADHAALPAQTGHIVMIAPPHGGSFMADLVSGREKLKGLYEWVCGKVGHDLTTAGALALPPVTAPVGIITAGLWHNDGWVAWESSLIPAAADTTHVRFLPHTLMLWNPALAPQVIHFLRHGRFTSKKI